MCAVLQVELTSPSVLGAWSVGLVWPKNLLLSEQTECYRHCSTDGKSDYPQKGKIAKTTVITKNNRQMMTSLQQ